MGQIEGMINVGVEGRDQFGCDIASRFKIHNYQYDCTTSRVPDCNANNKDYNTFESACLSAETEKTDKYLYYSLADMVKERNLTNKHIMMKLDAEGAEYPGLRNFPLEDLKWVDVLVIEFHMRGHPIKHPQVWGNL